MENFIISQSARNTHFFALIHSTIDSSRDLRPFHTTLKSGVNPDSTISHLIWINCNMHSIRLQVNLLAEVNWPDSVRIRSISKAALVVR